MKKLLGLMMLVVVFFLASGMRIEVDGPRPVPMIDNPSAQIQVSDISGLLQLANITFTNETGSEIELGAVKEYQIFEARGQFLRNTPMVKVGGEEQLTVFRKKLQPNQSTGALGRLGEISKVQVKVPGRVWGSTQYDFYPATDPSIDDIIASEKG